jgi:glycosyltransferase involved in cell wall biosynthesis
MTVSVCIPTYNSAKYLRECIESVLTQTYQDFELIVSDNASTDATCDIVRSFSDARIRLHRLGRNMGMAFNFNKAADLARAKYVKLLCYDDVLAPKCLEMQVGMLERHPEVVMVASGFRYIDGSRRKIRDVMWFHCETVLRDVEVIAETLIYGNILGPPSAVLMRQSSRVKGGAFSEDLPQLLDVDMWLRLAALGPVGYLPEPLCGFRLHPHTTTSDQRKLGVVRQDILRITEIMLRSVVPSPWARRVAWGRVAGSFLKLALAGLRRGCLKWPLAAVWQALRIDPGFAGLAVHQLLFRPGLIGLRAREGRMLTVSPGSTLRKGA